MARSKKSSDTATILARELDDARAYQAAIDDVLQLVGTSPSDLQPIFDAIVARAMALCDANAAYVDDVGC